MARSRQRQTSRRTNGRQGRTRPLDNEGLIPILARAVREIESAVDRGQAVSVRSRFQAVALLALTACFPLAMGLQLSLPLLLAGAFLHGFGLEIFSVNWDLSIQQNVAEDKLARVYSFDLVGSFVARPLGLAFTGPVAAAVGFDRWLVVVGLVMGGSALLSLLFPSVQRLERRTGPSDQVLPV